MSCSILIITLFLFVYFVFSFFSFFPFFFFSRYSSQGSPPPTREKKKSKKKEKKKKKKKKKEKKKRKKHPLVLSQPASCTNTGKARSWQPSFSSLTRRTRHYSGPVLYSSTQPRRRHPLPYCNDFTTRDTYFTSSILHPPSSILLLKHTLSTTNSIPSTLKHNVSSFPDAHQYQPLYKLCCLSATKSYPRSIMRHTPASSRGSSAPNTPPLSILTSEDKDVFRLPATEALRLMARSIEVLVSFTGDIPPTPPLSRPSSPALSAVSEEGLQTPSESPDMDASTLNPGYPFGSNSSCDLDGVKVKKRQAKTIQEEEGKFIAAGVDNALQYGAITRKFWSKSIPEIPIEDYIFRFVVLSSCTFLRLGVLLTSGARIHRFCPMSTAVYIAASVYLHRLAVVDRILPITRYNVHRLVLAALRIASKACEDLSHSHKRFAKVGGLSENELSRLEVSKLPLYSLTLLSSSLTISQVSASSSTLNFKSASLPWSAKWQHFEISPLLKC